MYWNYETSSLYFVWKAHDVGSAPPQGTTLAHCLVSPIVLHGCSLFRSTLQEHCKLLLHPARYITTDSSRLRNEEHLAEHTKLHSSNPGPRLRTRRIEHVYRRREDCSGLLQRQIRAPQRCVPLVSPQKRDLQPLGLPTSAQN
jgi:hypothetical protein